MPPLPALPSARVAALAPRGGVEVRAARWDLAPLTVEQAVRVYAEAVARRWFDSCGTPRLEYVLEHDAGRHVRRLAVSLSPGLTGAGRDLVSFTAGLRHDKLMHLDGLGVVALTARQTPALP